MGEPNTFATWTVYAEQPAGEFAQFLALAAKGAPFTEPTVTANWGALTPDVQTAMAAQQRVNMEKSVRFCREMLGI